MAVEIVLGAEADVRSLYSYPNNFNEVGFLEQHCPPAHRRRQLRATRRDGEIKLDLTILIGVQMLLRQVDEDLLPHTADAIVDLGDL